MRISWSSLAPTACLLFWAYSLQSAWSVSSRGMGLWERRISSATSPLSSSLPSIRAALQRFHELLSFCSRYDEDRRTMHQVFIDIWACCQREMKQRRKYSYRVLPNPLRIVPFLKNLERKPFVHVWIAHQYGRLSLVVNKAGRLCRLDVGSSHCCDIFQACNNKKTFTIRNLVVTHRWVSLVCVVSKSTNH